MSFENKLIVHNFFNDTVDDLRTIGLKLPDVFSEGEMDFSNYIFPPNADVVNNIEEIKGYNLDATNGEQIVKESPLICAYDESFKKFSSLEGTSVLLSHSLILQHNTSYIPINFLTLNFYTRAKKYCNSSKNIKYSIDPDTDSKIDYVKDRSKFLLDNVPENSILFIDGPLIGGQVSSYTTRLNQGLLDKNVIPIFFVKNSSSSLIVNYDSDLGESYNSDIHWAYVNLKVGERSNFFTYSDQKNKENAKVFFYLKAFDLSPQRVEIHAKTFEKHKAELPRILDLIYYLLLVQGDLKNPQIRPIAIAEKFARDVLRLIDLNDIIRNAGLIPTMNQERFG